MINNIIFDWSGVINDNLDDHLEVVNKIFVECGADPITKRQLRQKWIQPYMDFYNNYCKDLTFDKQRGLYLKNMQLNGTRKPYRNMPELLIKLKKRGFNLYLLTSDTKKTIELQVVEYGLNGVFDEISLDQHDKMNALSIIVNKYGLKKNSSVFVGDTTHEIACARQLGIKSIAVTWGFTSSSRLAKEQPDYLVNSPRALERILI